MKKFGIIALVLVLTLFLYACSRRNNTKEPMAPTTVPTEAPTITPVIPETDPTMDTNIPDPEVNGNSDTETNNATDADPNEGEITGTDETNDPTSEFKDEAKSGRFMDGK